ncbi:S-layer homology domain-containing protein [Paenibacillus aestuarii]|uniref:S-layer homology domain-containing protein n=1 Tax=Paenibacillus aestuarii TaxID=516965 RepID=A0ABW0K9D3_9BACL|nr:S-layer homology domain-containing protein [Paenibacillus aestuarii]
MWRRTILSILASSVCLLFAATPSFAEDAAQFELSVSSTESVNGEFIVTLKGQQIQDLYGFEVKLGFDANNVEVTKADTVIEGFSVSPIVKNNEVTFAHTKIGQVDGEKGNVDIGTVTFKAKKAGTTNISWNSVKLVDHNLKSQTLTPNNVIHFTKIFSDLVDHWAKSDVMLMVDKKIVEGMDDDHFAPDTNVTRAQFATLLTKALNLQAGTGQNPFEDVTSGAWYEDTVKKAYAAGLINGIADNVFAPEQNITREEMTAMLIRAKAYASGTKIEDMSVTNERHFSDDAEVSDWAKKVVALAVDFGLMNGRTEQEFAPLEQASRAEAVVVLKRLIVGLK